MTAERLAEIHRHHTDGSCMPGYAECALLAEVDRLKERLDLMGQPNHGMAYEIALLQERADKAEAALEEQRQITSAEIGIADVIRIERDKAESACAAMRAFILANAFDVVNGEGRCISCASSPEEGHDELNCEVFRLLATDAGAALLAERDGWKGQWEDQARENVVISRRIDTLLAERDVLVDDRDAWRHRRDVVTSINLGLCSETIPQLREERDQWRDNCRKAWAESESVVAERGAMQSDLTRWADTAANLTDERTQLQARVALMLAETERHTDQMLVLAAQVGRLETALQRALDSAVLSAGAYSEKYATKDDDVFEDWVPVARAALAATTSEAKP